MFLFLLFVSTQNLRPTHSLASPYTSYQLEQTCGKDGSKQSLHLNTQAAVFTFNSTNRRKLDCHLELHLHSKSLGFSVFIETLKIQKSSGCSRDFLQFGRDKFVITTHLSEKYCDTVEHSGNITDEDGVLLGYDFKGISYPRREYIESRDKEMDIWIELQPAQNNQNNEVKLVIAPFRKSCDEEEEEYYKKCPDTDRCFRKQYFCDNIVKCAVLTEDERNKFCVKKTDSGGFMYLPVIIIVIVIITLTLIGFGIKHFLSHLQSIEIVALRNSVNPRTEQVVQLGTSLLSPETDQRRPNSQEGPSALHQQELSLPPSYDEVIGEEFRKDPPKYSEVLE